MKLYVVQMFRWGDEEGHNYIEGIYSDRDLAEQHAKAEEEQRSGKYEAKIWTHPLNEPRQLKYMTGEQIDQKFRKFRQEHPEWFNSDGTLKLEE